MFRLMGYIWPQFDDSNFNHWGLSVETTECDSQVYGTAALVYLFLILGLMFDVYILLVD